MSTLTEREIQLLKLSADGLTSKQIARQLHVTEQTIKNAMCVIISKLRATTRTNAVAIALSIGLIRLDRDNIEARLNSDLALNF